MEAEKMGALYERNLRDMLPTGFLAELGEQSCRLIDEVMEKTLAEIAAAHAAEMEEMREALEEADSFIINRKPTKGGAAVVARIRKLLAATPKRVRWVRRVKLEEQEVGFFELLAEGGEYIGALYDDEDKSEGYTDGEVHTVAVMEEDE